MTNPQNLEPRVQRIEADMQEVKQLVMSKPKIATELLIETMRNFSLYGTSYPTEEQIEAERKKANSKDA